jgi:hypothetical protein
LIFRWFEHTAPSGILAPGTKAVDGIYSGLNPDDFVGPDNAGYLDFKGAECAYYKLSAEGTVSPWAQEFANNECESCRTGTAEDYPNGKTSVGWFIAYNLIGQRPISSDDSYIAPTSPMLPRQLPAFITIKSSFAVVRQPL